MAFLAMLAAWNCLSGQESSAVFVRQSFGKFCDEDCVADLRYTLRYECEAALETEEQEEAAAAETIGEVVAAEETLVTDPIGSDVVVAPSDGGVVVADTTTGRRLAEVEAVAVADPCEVCPGGEAVTVCPKVVDRFIELKMAQLDSAGWAMVFVAEVELLQCACLLYKGCLARRARRTRAASPYREPSI